nr:GNAT family N-acetyltransferase [uncultured Acetatifactor sp.]
MIKEYRMQIAVYDTLPEEAIQIRKSVFVTEQGFYDEFDETDYNARHLVLLYDGIPAGTCRFFRDNATKEFMIGRLAVLRQYRGKALGTCLMERAEQEIRKMGGERVLLHAQQQARPFYEKHGYLACREPDSEQGCPHIWMAKNLSFTLE